MIAYEQSIRPLLQGAKQYRVVSRSADGRARGVAGLRGCGVAGLRGCGVAGLRGCGVAGLRCCLTSQAIQQPEASGVCVRDACVT
jgi:hypothetical protein